MNPQKKSARQLNYFDCLVLRRYTMKSSCLTIDQLIAFMDKTISKKERKIVENHIAHCDSCLEMVATTAQIVNETAEIQPTQTLKEVIEKLKDVIKDVGIWVKNQFPPLWIEPDPAYAYVRSDNQSEGPKFPESTLIKRIMNNLSAEIFFEKSGTDLISIKVYVTERNQIAENVSIYFETEDKGRSARMLEPPYVSFDDIPFGNYCIIIEQNNEEKGKFYFKVNKKGISEKE